MKKFLFGLGAMLVGAGLMFVFMHGEVIASDRDDQTKIMHCEYFIAKESRYEDSIGRLHPLAATYCKIKDLTCIINGRGTSCVRGSMF